MKTQAHISAAKTGSGPDRGRKSSPGIRILRVAGIVLVSLVGLVMLFFCAISIYLTPERLTDIVNSKASQYLDADVRAHNISYTLWRSFPRFKITTDSITVRSRTLDSVPAAIRSKLPANADFLGSLKNFSGSINVVDLLLNRYVIHDVYVDGLRINMVAYNDSINNYNILPPSEDKLKHVPYFSAHAVALRNPGAITYYSYASDTKATLQLSDLNLRRTANARHLNTYKLAIAGQVTARSAGISIFKKFPFSLDGDLRLRFDPFGVALTDYAIDLGEIHSRLSMSVGIGDDPRIESFDYKISSVNLMNLLGYIPQEYLPSLQGLKMDLPVSASARLLSSWSLSNEVFPSIEIDFHTPEGTIDYTVAGSGSRKGELLTYSLSHSPIEGRFIFDGNQPEQSHIVIPRFSISADGVDASIEAGVTRLNTDPLIEARLALDADISRAIRYIPAASSVRASGQLKSDTRLSCTLSDFSRQALADGLLNIHGDGVFDIYGLRLTSPADSLSIGANHIRARIGESASAITQSSLNQPHSRISINADKATVKAPFGTIKADDFRLLSTASSNSDITPESLRAGVPVRFDIATGNLLYEAAGADSRVEAGGFYVADVVATTAPGSFRKALSDGLRLGAGEMEIGFGGRKFRLRNPAVRISVSERTPGALDSLPAIFSGTMAGNVPAAHPSAKGTIPDDMPAHTPELLAPEFPPQLAAIFRNFSFSTDVTLDRCELEAPGLGKEDYIANLDLTLGEESLRLRHMDLELSGTPARLSGEIGNLRGFLTLPPSADNPIELRFDASSSRIDINRLTHNYVEACGGEAAIRRRPTSLPGDTLAMLIPRNIKADVNIHVGQTDYTNLKLTDLVARIGVADGVARVDSLGVATSFGRAEAGFVYDTSDIRHMGISGNVDIKSIDIVKFFKKFHSLLEMMPQMKNLSGYISVNGTLGSEIFPTMYLNVPSARADLNVEGRDLMVHQSKFIRKITKMMLIHTDADIHIEDICVRAALHDNLLQLYPFTFEFDRYKLQMLGVNNFNGNLYYHIAVEKSPVPFPFGINIQGMFRRPELRFGRARYNIREGEKVTRQIQVTDQVNMMHIMRELLKDFICTGARYDGTPTS